MTSNPSATSVLSVFVRAFHTPDLRKKLLFTGAMIVLFRFGANLPAPGISEQNVRYCSGTSSSTGVFAIMNLLSGNSLLHLTVFAIGILPYITASIIVQMLSQVIPRLEMLRKEGQTGQAKITQYTRYVSVGLGLMYAVVYVQAARTGAAFPGSGCGPAFHPLIPNFGIFYDDRAETHCNTNPAISGNQPTGQMFGGYYVGLPPDQASNSTHYYHNGAFYSDPRTSAYISMGLHQMPGNVWWRSWRELPPAAQFADCRATDPDFSWQGQWPMAGQWQTYTDPQSGQKFPVWEGHYTYSGTNLTFIPTYSGGMFEGLMPNEIVPETSWGSRSFGLADARTADVQIKYATQELHYPVWGMSPSSTADDTGNYGGYGVEGLAFPYHGGGADASNPNEGLSQCNGCATEDVVTPHASFLALDVAPQQAYANIQALRTLYPGVYGADGFFDAVNPTTGAIGHRDLVLDQSMIMAALDNALNNRALQRDFAKDPVSWAAHTYLELEHMSI